MYNLNVNDRKGYQEKHITASTMINKLLMNKLMILVKSQWMLLIQTAFFCLSLILRNMQMKKANMSSVIQWEEWEECGFVSTENDSGDEWLP